MIRIRFVGLGLTSLLSASACGSDSTDEGSKALDPATAHATLSALPYADNPSPNIAAELDISFDGTNTTVKVMVTGCPLGEHALHVHEGTSCGVDGSDAGDHWTATHDADTHAAIQKHGGVEDEDPGAIGSVSCGDDLTGELTFITEHWTLGTGEATDPTGHAVVLHGLDAADRVACGVIEAD
jgi:Cu/Zn superoxide dismutase